MRIVVPDNLLWRRKYIDTYENLIKNTKSGKQMAFWGGGTPSWTVIRITFKIQHYRWICTSPCRWLHKIAPLKTGEKNTSSSRATSRFRRGVNENFSSKTSTNSPNFQSTCCCSIIILINVLRHNDASFHESVLLSQLRNPPNPLNRLRFLSFFNGALGPNFNKIVDSWSGR